MNQHNILIIEDDTGIQALTKFSLEMDDYWQVTSAYVGKEGLFKAMNINPDVILLDLMMPDMGGIEILEKLQSDRTTDNIPVILFTAKLMEVENLELENKNVIGLITKPFDCLTLSAKILDCLKKVSVSRKLSS
jgi:CheY-like chemotaxis protein